MMFLRSISLAACAIAFFLGGGTALAIETKAKQAILMDDTTGTVLFEKNADELMHPSSMSKLMTVYAAFKRLKEGSIKLTDTLPVSEKAWRMQGSKMFVELGNRISVEDLLQGIIVQSGNDACVVLAEGLAGSEEAFAKELTALGQQIGLTRSTFVNATGWPDEGHLMTARDLATLAHRLIHDFPEYYHYFAEPSFTYHGIAQPNRNVLLHVADLGVDGLKTGHTEVGGYGITVSAKNPQGRRLILVINGLESEKERAPEAEALLRTGFRDFELVTIATPGQSVGEADVWFGTSATAPLTVAQPLAVTLPRLEKKNAKMMLVYNGPVPAPIKQGQHIADLQVELPGRTAQTFPLVAAQDVGRLSGLRRIVPAFSHYFLPGR